MSDVLRIGVIGAGGMGGRHVDNIHRLAKSGEVVAVMDADDDRAAAVAASCGAVAMPDPDELIARTDVDAVVIASPDDTHAPLAQACIAAGKPVLCEKPLATTLPDARRVVEAEVDGGRRLTQVGLMRFYDPAHTAVKARIDAGDIGRPLYFRGWHRNPAVPPFPTSAEVLINAAVHDMFSARWLLGAEVADIFVRGTIIDPARAQLELQLIAMTMENGAMASIEINKDSGYGYEVGVEIVGSGGVVTAAPHQAAVVRRGDSIHQGMDADWLERFQEAYVIEVQSWAASVLSRRPEGPSAWDGYVTLAVAEAGVKSLATGGPVAVSLGERPPLYA